MNDAASVTATTTIPTGTTRGAEVPGRRLLRRVGAVFAGLLTIFVLSTATDAVFHATGVYPAPDLRMADGLFLLATAYRVLFGVVGCYVTARLAPDRPLLHAGILGAIGVVISIAGALAMGDRGPLWYALAVIAMSPPCAWLGGKIRQRQLRAH